MMMGWDVDETTVRIRLLSNKVYDIWTNNNLIIYYLFFIVVKTHHVVNGFKKQLVYHGVLHSTM